MSLEAELTDLLRSELYSGRVRRGVERTGDDQSGGRAGFTDETQDCGIVCERLAGPALADPGEEAVLDGISLGSVGRIVSDGDEQAERVG